TVVGAGGFSELCIQYLSLFARIVCGKHIITINYLLLRFFQHSYVVLDAAFRFRRAAFLFPLVHFYSLFNCRLFD
ncbi:hypothetical protein D039_1631B, partial [Vibrio parahaemolyticus EKP-028]